MNTNRIGVVGLGYVGLPLACLFSTKYPVVAFDRSTHRVNEIKQGRDSSGMLTKEQLNETFHRGMVCTSDLEQLKECNIYVVAVPTPVKENHLPDTDCLESASREVGKIIKKGDIVVYESTVYPGLTESVCLPIIEQVSGLKLNVDFFAGYSPERINPGDSLHSVQKIRKITSGSTPEAADRVDALYASVIEEGTYKASSIKVAEAAKLMENTQRDVNIAFMNEMAMIFQRIGVDTHEVIDAARTKWNFLPFEPGLVGGHCIGVDPYYLIQLAQAHDVHPRMIIEARSVNENMAGYVVNQVNRLLQQRSVSLRGAKVLLVGFTFKEDCPDIRNTKVMNIWDRFREFTRDIVAYDPWVDPEEARRMYGIDVQSDWTEVSRQQYDAIVYCVKHKKFKTLNLEQVMTPRTVLYDIKGAANRDLVTERL